MDKIHTLLDSDLRGLDPRKFSKSYTMKDIIWTVIFMYILKQESRNRMNQLIKKDNFKKSFYSIYKVKLPHLDTCHDILKRIEPEKIKSILGVIFKFYITKKFFSRSRLGGNLVLLLDASGIGNVEPIELDIVENEIFEDLTERNIFNDIEESEINNTEKVINLSTWSTGKTTKNGIRFFTRSLISLRVVGPNGISLVIDWEPINTDDGSTKEDCEQNSAQRLLSRFKSCFKRLPVTLVADGLYTNQTFMKLAIDYGYNFIFTLKDEALKKIWIQINEDFGQKIGEQATLIKDEKGSFEEKIMVANENTQKDFISREFEWMNNLNHAGLQINWCSCKECVNGDRDQAFYFSVVTNLNINKKSVQDIITFARSRNRIEDGFNTQKNRGYKLKHKFSERSDNAAMNYITLLCVAEIINNIVLQSDWVQRTYFCYDEKQTELSLLKGMSELIPELNHKNVARIQEKMPSLTAYTMPLHS